MRCPKLLIVLPAARRSRKAKMEMELSNTLKISLPEIKASSSSMMDLFASDFLARSLASGGASGIGHFSAGVGVISRNERIDSW